MLASLHSHEWLTPRNACTAPPDASLCHHSHNKTGASVEPRLLQWPHTSGHARLVVRTRAPHAHTHTHTHTHTHLCVQAPGDVRLVRLLQLHNVNCGLLVAHHLLARGRSGCTAAPDPCCGNAADARRRPRTSSIAANMPIRRGCVPRIGIFSASSGWKCGRRGSRSRNGANLRARSWT